MKNRVHRNTAMEIKSIIRDAAGLALAFALIMVCSPGQDAELTPGLAVVVVITAAAGMRSIVGIIKRRMEEWELENGGGDAAGSDRISKKHILKYTT